MGDDDPVFQKLPDDELRKVAKELSADTLSAISTLFPVATSIQQWLKTCLEVIFHSSVSGNTAGGTSNTMTWNSPLGFPITQGYREQITETVCPCDIALLKKNDPLITHCCYNAPLGSNAPPKDLVQPAGRSAQGQLEARAEWLCP